MDPETRDRVLVALGIVDRHLPGLHDQSSHGRKGPKGVAKSAAKKAVQAVVDDVAKTEVLPGSKPRRPRKRATPEVSAASPYHRNTDRVADLARAVEGGRITDDRAIAGGWVGDTRVRTYDDGTKVVYKKGRDFWAAMSAAAEQQADAEQLASLVARSLGLRAPRVYRNSPDEVHMEFVDDAVIAKDPSIYTDRWDFIQSDDGRLVGLLDLLIANGDRHPGNWMVGGDGHLVPIDHGLSFQIHAQGRAADPPQRFRSPFAFEHFFELRGEWKPNDLTAEDFAQIRTRLADLRGDFEHRGRADWHDFMLERLDAVATHATGSTSRLPVLQ